VDGEFRRIVFLVNYFLAWRIRAACGLLAALHENLLSGDGEIAANALPTEAKPANSDYSEKLKNAV
jgi:hypothetical protein